VLQLVLQVSRRCGVCPPCGGNVTQSRRVGRA